MKMQLLPSKGSALASSLGTPHTQTNRVTLRATQVGEAQQGGAVAGPAVSKTRGTQVCPSPRLPGAQG